MLEQPYYYLAQLDRPLAERPPEWRNPVWVDAVLRSALLEVKERDALAAENKRLRAFAQWVAAGEPSPAEYDPSADGCDEALSSGNSGDSELYGVLTVYYNMAQKAKAALSPQPPTASPSAPEGVSGDSERTCATCRRCALSCSGPYVEPSACSGCYEVPEHPHWEAKP